MKKQKTVIMLENIKENMLAKKEMDKEYSFLSTI